VTEIGAPARQGASLPEDRLAGDWSIAPAAKVTVDLHRTPIRKVLDQMAQQGKLNIVPADELKGEITLKLRDTPWRAALSAICLALDLVAAREGNVIRVVPREAWLKEVGP
jgi:type IV pilus assembly protein PilQ